MVFRSPNWLFLIKESQQFAATNFLTRGFYQKCGPATPTRQRVNFSGKIFRKEDVGGFIFV
jgi:hypothetical protein